MSKPLIQICFSLKNGLTIDEIARKLKIAKDRLDLKYDKDNYTVASCHLSKKLCEDKGFSTDVPDTFAAIFGNNYVCELESEPDFDTAMSNIENHRTSLAERADDLILLSNDTITNVALELELFSKHHIMVI